MDELAFRYVECDIPDGMTLDEWRCRRRAATSRRGRFTLHRFRRHSH